MLEATLKTGVAFALVTLGTMYVRGSVLEVGPEFWL